MSDVGYLHPRLRNAKTMKKREWTAQHIYVGRGKCPCKTDGCGHDVGLGNPYSIHADGGAVPILFHAMLEKNARLQVRVVETCKAPAILVCWCDGPNATWCHGETYCRLGDGESIVTIAADVLGRL